MRRQVTLRKKRCYMQKDFVPQKIFLEKAAQEYDQTEELIEKYPNVPVFFIEQHHKIDQLRSQPLSAFPSLKKYLVIGVRKSLTYVKNQKTSDYLVPYTSSGCSGMCLYCYLVCNFFQCSYLRVFVNRQQMMDKLIRTAQKSEKHLTLEIGSNSDLVLENTVTGNLEWTIEQFAPVSNAQLTLPTKFHMVKPLLGLKHSGNVTIRMSLNPDLLISRVELGTSSLSQRLQALIHLYEAGYPVGILIAPVMMVEGYEELYKGLMQTISDVLPERMKRGLCVEIIFMTYGVAQNQINQQAFPNAYPIFDSQKMKICGRGKYRYKSEYFEQGKKYLLELVKYYLPQCHIAYVC